MPARTWNWMRRTWEPSIWAAIGSARSRQRDGSTKFAPAASRVPTPCSRPIAPPGAPATFSPQRQATGSIIPVVDRETCLSFDRQDPLASVRDEFVVPEGGIYLGGNSLCALPRPPLPRLSQGIAEESGRGLIRSWD